MFLDQEVLKKPYAYALTGCPLQRCLLMNYLCRKHADLALEHYVTETLMDIITTFFRSPFSDQSTTVQVGRG